jgi:outer membrane receptor protein involved in Fe transport
MKTMNCKTTAAGAGFPRAAAGIFGVRRFIAASALALFAGAGAAFAQQTTPPPETADEIVQMSAFEVVESQSDSYEALNTASLSNTNKSLDKIPITIEAITQALMDDLGTTDVKNLLYTYATGVTPGENSAGSSTAEGRGDGDRFTLYTLGIRGLSAGAARRNGLFSFGWSAEGFSMDKMEIIRGPQALIYGINPPGGVVNITTKKAVFGKTFARATFRYDQEWSKRWLLDANFSGSYHLGRTGPDNRFAVRVALIRDDTNYWKDLLGRETRGEFLEAGLELHRPTRTTLRVEWEKMGDRSTDGTQRVYLWGANKEQYGYVPDQTALSLMLANNDSRVDGLFQGKINWNTVESLNGTGNGTRRDQETFSATLSSKILPWLEAQVVAAKSIRSTRTVNASGNMVRAPLTGSNYLDAWAVLMRPTLGTSTMNPEQIRATLSANFQIGKSTRHNLVAGWEKFRTHGEYDLYRFYEVDGTGNIKYSAGSPLDTVDRGRTLMTYLATDIFTDGWPTWITLDKDEYTRNGVLYRADKAKYPTPEFVTEGNPLGLNGGTSDASYTRSEYWGAFGALFSTWAGGRLETLLGLRYDDTDARNLTEGKFTHGSGLSGNAGFVYNLTAGLSLYGSFSRNINPDTSGGLLYNHESIPEGEGRAFEAGVKLNSFGGKLSGSIALYDATGKNEITRLNTYVRSATDPAGINGHYFGTIQPTIAFDRNSRGVEVQLTARPLKGWKMQFGYSYNVGKNARSIYVPFLYNDEFRTSEAGEVLLADGTPLLVPVSTTVPVAEDGKTYNPGVATQVLTMDILRNGDAAGHYRAQFAADSGRITNADALGLLVPGVGTGRVGLPIAMHQFGWTPPSGRNEVLVINGDDRTLGNPTHALTFTTSYAFTSGFLKGLGIGGNVTKNWDTVLYYYTDTADNNTTKKFKLCDELLVNPFISYSFKPFRRVTWKIQVNAWNVFDKRYMTIFPAVSTGAPDNARLMRGPRTFILTNTVSF